MAKMAACKHHNIYYDYRKVGKECRASCGCGKIKTNWHLDSNRASRAYKQNYGLYLKEKNAKIS